MADRSVLVRLRADISDFSRKFASAAATSALLSKGLDNTGNSARGADKEIDKLSGRLNILRDAVLTMGPAIVPLGAAAIPALTGSVVALGSAAAGLGVSILALQGVGDALGALDDYQLERTPENLAKLAAEMEKMGPTGAHFVRFLDDLEPELKSLQMTARDGLLPGVEDGISSLLTDLPQIRDLVSQLAGAMGELASDAGADLAGPEWEAFFEYLRTDAAPALEEFSRTVGNFAQGFADMLVAFAPASRDFSGGMLEMSQRFAEWSAGLENNDSFQAFVDYIRQSGPQAVELLGSVVKALASIVEAMAPYGSVVLPVLTQFADLIGAIASTDAGSAFFAAAAGLTLFNRAAAMTGPALTKMTAVFAANPWALAAATLTYAVTEIATADDELVAATQRAQDALDSGDTTQMRSELTALQDELDNTALKMYPDAPESFFGALQDGIPVLGTVTNGIEQAGDLWTRFGGATDDAKAKQEELQDAIANGRGGVLGARDAIVRYAGGALQSAAALEEETAALRDSIDAMREKRQEALRGLNAELDYQQAIDDARRSLKENGATVDETTEKGRNNLRTLYALAAGWNNQSDAAKSASGSMSAAKQNFIDTAVAMDMPIAKARRLANELFEIPAARSTKVTVETEAAMARLLALKNRLDAIRSKSVTVSINTGGATGGGSPMGVVLGGEADGGTIPGRRNPYGDKGLYMLAPGEEVISNRRGQADRHRALLKKINAGLADGGSAHGWAQQSGPYMGINGLSPALNTFQELKDALKKFQKQLEEATKAVDRERRQRDDLIAASKSFASAVGGAFAKADPFSGGLSDFNLAVSANTNDSNAAKAALAAAANKGLDGPLYQALAASGNLQLLQEFAGLSAAQIAQKEQQFASQSAAQTGLGAAAAEHAFAEAIKDQTKELKEAQKERQKYAALTKEVQRRLDQLPDRVERGARAGVADRDRRTSQRVAAGR